MDSLMQRLQNQITGAMEQISASEATASPDGKWNAAQVFEHLHLTYRATIKGLERCLCEGRPLARKPKMADRVRAAVVTRLNYMPTGRKANERLVPRGMAMEQLSGELPPTLLAMDEAIGRCEARFGRRTRILDHPILGPLTGHEWRKFHWVHGQHHLKQIWSLRGK